MKRRGRAVGLFSGLGSRPATAYQVGRDGATGGFRTMARERGRRRGMKWLIGLVIVLGLAWTGYWYAVSRAAETVIARMSAAISAHGGSLSWSEQGISGFPLSLDFRSSEVKFTYAPASVAAGINRVTASAPLYYPGRVQAAFVGPVVFDSPEAGIAVSASWSAASTLVDVG